jgi:ferredoxin-NADP reductase
VAELEVGVLAPEPGLEPAPGLEQEQAARPAEREVPRLGPEALVAAPGPPALGTAPQTAPLEGFKEMQSGPAEEKIPPAVEVSAHALQGRWVAGRGVV